MQTCDPITGVCSIPEDNTATEAKLNPSKNTIIHYIGDPMCSWCWGISPELSRLVDFCEENGYSFQITVGGLRAGGGMEWNEEFKTFLRNEWQYINQSTGQPFGFTLLEAEHFDYDTEPPCRAVVTSQLISNDTKKLWNFFSRTQEKFYVKGEDPKQVAFYESICDEVGIDYQQFSALFDTQISRQATIEAFQRCRSWGVNAFPSLVLEHEGKLYELARGKTTANIVLNRFKQVVN